LQKHQYRELDIADNPDAEPPCSHTKSAIIVFGKHAGRTLTVCTDTDCPVHNPHVAAQHAADADSRRSTRASGAVDRVRAHQRRGSALV